MNDVTVAFPVVVLVRKIIRKKDETSLSYEHTSEIVLQKTFLIYICCTVRSICCDHDRIRSEFVLSRIIIIITKSSKEF